MIPGNIRVLDGWQAREDRLLFDIAVYVRMANNRVRCADHAGRNARSAQRTLRIPTCAIPGKPTSCATEHVAWKVIRESSRLFRNRRTTEYMLPGTLNACVRRARRR